MLLHYASHAYSVAINTAPEVVWRKAFGKIIFSFYNAFGHWNSVVKD